MMHGYRPNHVLQRFFSGLSEYIFHSQLGVADPPLIAYIGDLLVRFVRLDAMYRVRNLEGRPLRELAEMMAEAENRGADSSREVHRHIGDFALFWTGVYPEALPRMQHAASKDYFVDFCTQGKHAYFVASTIDTARAHDPPCELLERLSREFELCTYGLRRVREQWEHDAGETAGVPLLIN
jgi:hypothetical protein